MIATLVGYKDAESFASAKDIYTLGAFSGSVYAVLTVQGLRNPATVGTQVWLSTSNYDIFFGTVRTPTVTTGNVTKVEVLYNQPCAVRGVVWLGGTPSGCK